MNIYTTGALVAVNLFLAAYLIYVWRRVKVLSKEVSKPKVKLQIPRNKKVFLNKKQAAKIKKRLDEGTPAKAIAKEVGCSYSLVWKIKNDKWAPKRVK